MVSANFKKMDCKCSCCDKAAIMELVINSEKQEQAAYYPMCEKCLLDFLKVSHNIKKIMGGA